MLVRMLRLGFWFDDYGHTMRCDPGQIYDIPEDQANDFIKTSQAYALDEKIENKSLGRVKEVKDGSSKTSHSSSGGSRTTRRRKKLPKD